MKLVYDNDYKKGIIYNLVNSVNIVDFGAYKDLIVHVTTWTYNTSKMSGKVSFDYDYNHELCSHYVNRFCDYEECETALQEITMLDEASHMLQNAILNI